MMHVETHALAPETDASRATTWLRRAITIPGLLVICLLDFAALPFVLLGALVADLVRHRRLAAVRFHLAVAVALGMHVVGLFLVSGAWVAGVLTGRERERRLDFRFEAWWASVMWRAAIWLFGMNVVVEGGDALGGGPIVFMSRHASLLDVLLPVIFLSGQYGLALRYVAKRELLWDPFVDIVGHRVPSVFVRRDSRDHAREIQLVDELASDLGRHDGVVIFPEGTRFTEAKRRRILAKLEGTDEAAFAHASRLKNLLPAHAGGPLGVLEHAKRADVIFCAHTGLEGANHLRDLRAGSLIGATVYVRFWRVPASEIPSDAAARLMWLRAWWERLDAWIEAHRRPPSAQ